MYLRNTFLRLLGTVLFIYVKKHPFVRLQKTTTFSAKRNNTQPSCEKGVQQ